MRKLLNKPWFVAVLALVAVAFVVHSLLPRRAVDGRTGFTPDVVDDATESGMPADSTVTLRSDDLSSLNFTAAKRDPFTPSVRVAALRTAAEQPKPDVVESVHLSAIWAQGGIVYLLINGRIHQPGDEIGRLKIDQVTTDGVWLAHWKGRDLLTLGNDFTLTTPAAMANPPSPAL